MTWNNENLKTLAKKLPEHMEEQERDFVLTILRVMDDMFGLLERIAKNGAKPQ